MLFASFRLMYDLHLIPVGGVKTGFYLQAIFNRCLFVKELVSAFKCLQVHYS